MRVQSAAAGPYAFRPFRAGVTEGSAGAGAPEDPAAREAGAQKAGARQRPEAGPRRPEDLDDKEKAQLMRLQQRDREVRAHEAAHAAAAGMLGGGASYDYVTGPDGRQYAIGGEVPVRISSGSSPEEAIRNAQQVRAAALAPAEPSGQDRAVAAQAAAIEAAARAELAEMRSLQAQARIERPEAPRQAEAPRTEATDAEKPSAQGTQETRPQREQAERPVDPEETARQLEAEMRSTRGSYRHMHLASGCGNCSAAAARYL